jgi:hypothetical protein
VKNNTEMPVISETIVASLPSPESGNKLHYFSGAFLDGRTAPSGFAVRVTAKGTKSFVLYYRVKGKGYLATLGSWAGNKNAGTLGVSQAIFAANKLAIDLQSRQDPRPKRTQRLEALAKEGTIGDILEKFVSQLRGREDNRRRIMRSLKRLAKPIIGEIPAHGDNRIGRGDLDHMMEHITNNYGIEVAQKTIAYLQSAFDWYASRDAAFVSPLGNDRMRARPKQRRPLRVLTDEEIGDILTGIEMIAEPPSYAPFIRSLLIHRPSCHQVGQTDSSDNSSNTVTSNYFVKVPFNEYAQARRELDKAIAKTRLREGRPEMTRWTMDDLRHTARELKRHSQASADASPSLSTAPSCSRTRATRPSTARA